MNLFDVAAGLILAVSALVGFSRGAVLEMVTLFASAGAAALSIYLLPFTTPVVHAAVRPAWAAEAVAATVAFSLAYVALRVLGGRVSRALHGQGALGSLDRVAGLGFGTARALVVLGVVYLAASLTSLGRPPAPLTRAWLYPLCRVSGRALVSLAPGGLAQVAGFGRMLQDRASAATTPREDAASDAADPAPLDVGAPDKTPPDTAAADAAPRRSLQVVSGEPPPHPRRHHRRQPEPAE